MPSTMLSRAAIRALRLSKTTPSPFPRTAPVASTSQQLRFYANKKSSSPKFNPKEQPEFDAQSAPERNTAPETEPAEPIEPEPAEPQKPLPDLRQGIPSTFAAEFAKAQAAAEGKTHRHDPDNVTEDPTREPASGGRETGELPKSAYETSTDRRRNKFANWSYVFAAFAGVTGTVFMGRPWESEEEEKAHADAPQGWSPALMYKRAHARLTNQVGYYTEPTFPKLLPDMDPAPPLTLVLSLEDLLVHSEWTTKNGWRTAKRPGVDYFLRYLSQYYELVIFTSVKSMDADPIIRKLDPFQMVMWPLFREATRYEKGEYVKDLSCLNRDLSKTIIVDTNASHVKLQPENAIVLPKWKGQPGDTGLVGLIPFLEYLAMLAQGSPNLDVRQALKSMEGKDIPKEFALREAKMRAQFLKDIEADNAKKGKPRVGGFLSNQLGLGKQGMILSDGTNVSEGMAQGKMMIDMFREIGRKNYEELDKEIRTNGQKYLKEREEEEKKMQEEQMKSMKTSAFGWLAGAPPPQEAPATATPEQK